MNFKKIDTHIHGEFSSDSTNRYEDIIQAAISRKYEYICFTEHMDLVPFEMVNYGVLPLRKYFNRISDLKEKYQGQIVIGFGIELGESHLTLDKAKELFQIITPDYIIGSLHLLKSLKNLSTPINFSLQDNIIMQYYQEVKEMVIKGGIDSLGHLGIFKREMQDPSFRNDQPYGEIIQEILTLMIERRIALEVNYSGYRSSWQMHLPGMNVLKLYKSLGGDLLTIGSDTHHLRQFDDFYDQTLHNIHSCGFKNIYYKREQEWIQKSISGD